MQAPLIYDIIKRGDNMILVTGLTGTSGSAFYNVLCRENYKEKIRVLTRPSTDLRMFQNTPLDIEFVEGDILNKESLKKALSGCDTVFHIAAKDLSRTLVEAIAEENRLIKCIFVSSTIVYSNYYRTSYLKNDENDYIEIFNQNNLPYVFIRPTMIFGTSTDRNISVFINWLKKFKVFPIVKNGKATIRPVHREDLAEAYYLILKNFDNLKQKEYVVSGERDMTLLEMFKIISEKGGFKNIFINIPFPLAKLAVNSVYLLSLKRIDFREKLDRLTEDRAYDNSVIKEELGFKPTSFEVRIEELIKMI